MITIYRQSWDANAQAGALLDAEGALILLACKGFSARIDEGWCPNPNVGCESDTESDTDAEALADLPADFQAPNLDCMTRCEEQTLPDGTVRKVNVFRHVGFVSAP